MRKRDTIFLCWLFHLPPTTCDTRRRPRRAPKVNRLLRTLKLNSLIFLKSPKSSAHTSGAWRHSHPPVTISIWDFYFDIREWHILPAHAWTHALMLHQTNTCAKRNVLSLTKSKGKIYKTKSLGYYITQIPLRNQQTIVLSRDFFFFCTYSFDDSMDCQNLWCRGSISPKTVLIFPKNFLKFRSDLVEKQSIINFGSYSSKSYASVVLGDSEVTFQREGEDAAFCPSLYRISFIYGVGKSLRKLKAASQEDQIQIWKEHFKNLYGNSSEVTDKPITKIIDSQLDIKLRLFTEKELNVLLTKIKRGKSCRSRRNTQRSMEDKEITTTGFIIPCLVLLHP